MHDTQRDTSGRQFYNGDTHISSVTYRYRVKLIMLAWPCVTTDACKQLQSVTDMEAIRFEANSSDAFFLALFKFTGKSA